MKLGSPNGIIRPNLGTPHQGTKLPKLETKGLDFVSLPKFGASQVALIDLIKLVED